MVMYSSILSIFDISKYNMLRNSTRTMKLKLPSQTRLKMYGRKPPSLSLFGMGGRFCDFLFAFVGDKTFSNKDQRKQVLSFKRRFHRKGRYRYNWKGCFP